LLLKVIFKRLKLLVTDIDRLVHSSHSLDEHGWIILDIFLIAQPDQTSCEFAFEVA
jgi:hypothetical protein